MPEGDTIYRTAARLRRALGGEKICGVGGRFNDLDTSRLVGRSIRTTEARGKHLLIHLDDGQAIHSHLGMTGSWHVYGHQQTWHKPAWRAALVLQLPGIVGVCFSPKTLDILSTGDLRRHPYLSRLGPDLLAEQVDVQEVVKRFRQRSELTVGEAVMNQTLVCGIGNVYKSELLFLEGIHPFTRLQDLSDEQLRQLMERAGKLMRRNLQGHQRTSRFGRDGQRLWVYDRRGEKCLRCGATICMRRQGDLGRSTYWCPTCQERRPS